MSATKSKAEPRFDLDLKYGQQGEKRIEEVLDWVVSGDLRIEVKRKRILDHYIYVETHCDKGRTGHYQPSGVNVTTASVWAFVIGDTGIHVAIPTALLREAIQEPSSRDKEETDGECPTRGKLVDFCVLLWRLKTRTNKPEHPPVPKGTKVVPYNSNLIVRR